MFSSRYVAVVGWFSGSRGQRKIRKKERYISAKETDEDILGVAAV